MQDLSSYEKRGYLRDDFRLFRLRDASMERIDWHFHDFHKIILFLSGHAAYSIEGKHYTLLPGDMVLIAQGCIHRPEIEDSAPYERIILYISPEYLSRCSSPECDLSGCFTRTRERYSYVLRPTERFDDYIHLLNALENTVSDCEPGTELKRRSLFTLFMVAVNRDCLGERLTYVDAASCDEKTVAILKYLNLHLSEPISIDGLAEQFYLSKYHMMRRFRTETGFTIHGYLTEKRLQMARELLSVGESAQSTCLQCGFQDYSAFSRAFKKRYGVSPGMINRQTNDRQEVQL